MCTNVLNSGFVFLSTRVRKFLLTEEENVFSLWESTLFTLFFRIFDCSFLRCLIGTSLCWFVLFWCPCMVLSLWRSFAYTLVWFSSLQLRRRSLFLRSNSIFSIFGRCLGHFCHFDCGEIIKLIENAFYVFLATFFILYMLLLPCSSHKWRRSIPSLIGDVHSDLRAIYLLRDFLNFCCDYAQFAARHSELEYCQFSFGIFCPLLTFYILLLLMEVCAHYRPSSFRIIVHFIYSFPYSTLFHHSFI